MKIAIIFVLQEALNDESNGGTVININKTTAVRYWRVNDNIIKCWISVEATISPQRLLQHLKNRFGRDIQVWVLYSCHHKPNNDNWVERCVIGQEGLSGSVFDGACQDIQGYINAHNNNPDFTDPLIIIMTYEGTTPETERMYPEWVKAISSPKAQFYDDKLKKIDKINNQKQKEPIRIAEFKTNNYTVLFVKENGYEISKNSKGIDKLLSNILSHSDWKDIEEKYIAVHDMDSYIKDISEFKNGIKYICNFHHITEDKDFCDLLITFLEPGEKNKNKDETCKQVIEQIKKLTIPSVLRSLSILKHRIMNLFLDLDIDLQGIYELLSRGGGDKAQKYYEEAFNNNSLCKQLKEKINEAKEILILSGVGLYPICERLGKKINKAKEILEESEITKEEKKKIEDKLNEISEIIKEVKNDKEFEMIKRWVNNKRNPFHKWLESLGNTIDELMRSKRYLKNDNR